MPAKKLLSFLLAKILSVPKATIYLPVIASARVNPRLVVLSKKEAPVTKQTIKSFTIALVW